MLGHFAAYFGQFFMFNSVLCHPLYKTVPCSKSFYTYFRVRFILFLYAVTDVNFYFKQPLYDRFTCIFYFENVF